ncbi:hypothetical protein [Campylobacter sp. US33a]|nr:hypothetical protein [Campylobacter sp. US33a]
MKEFLLNKVFLISVVAAMSLQAINDNTMAGGGIGKSLMQGRII